MNEKIELPTASKVSFKSGMWLVCHDGSDVIRLYGSLKSGKEKVYFNENGNFVLNSDETISFDNSLLMSSFTHPFQDTNGLQYEFVEFPYVNKILNLF